MWEALRRYSVHGRVLAAFQSLYGEAHIAMKGGADAGEAPP